LVGFGRIAQATARRAKFGLGMNIAYHSRRRSAEDVEAEVSAAFHQDLDELLSHVDVVSLHIPGGAATRHLIDARRLGLMRRDAFLINTARGDVLDQSALEEVLANRRIAGAGLDVFAAEPHVPDTLRQLPNATLLPHLGSATAEVRAAMGRRAFDNVQAYAAGKPLLDPIVDVADV
jgi:lactate dehydrogenase-like 2-hydroxyacid dehydrogenase